MPSQAYKQANISWFRRADPRLAEVEARCLEAAQRTGDRAYEFVRYDDGSLLEVRVWPDATSKLSEVHPKTGLPLT